MHLKSCWVQIKQRLWWRASKIHPAEFEVNASQDSELNQAFDLVLVIYPKPPCWPRKYHTWQESKICMCISFESERSIGGQGLWLFPLLDKYFSLSTPGAGETLLSDCCVLQVGRLVPTAHAGKSSRRQSYFSPKLWVHSLGANYIVIND